jgi:hypothetical protein
VSHIEMGRRKLERDAPPPGIDALMILSCVPVVAITAIVIAISGGVEVGFLIPAIVCGAMVGMLMFVSIRDRSRP